MSSQKSEFFTLHELLVMAALAALGGVSSSALSWVRAALGSLIPFPGAMQCTAGLHVLWLVLAMGLIRKPGTATVCGLIKGAIELLTGNPHGLLVLLYSGLGGVSVDVVWMLVRGRHHPLAYALAGGFGTASNVLVLKFVGSLHGSGLVNAALLVLAAVAFVSGVVFAGLLGWWLLGALCRAGVAGVPAAAPLQAAPRRAWLGIGVLAVVVVLMAVADRVSTARANAQLADPTSSSAQTSSETVTTR